VNIHVNMHSTDMYHKLNDKDEDTFRLNMRHWILKHPDGVFRAIQTWGMVMVILQLATLCLIILEPPGFMHMDNGTYMPRYISDNIALHQGFGALMVLSFIGSFIVITFVTVSDIAGFILIFLVGGATFGGVGVVIFHSPCTLQHFISAGIFIGCAIFTFIIVTATTKSKFVLRDAFLIVLAIALTCGFSIPHYLFRQADGTRARKDYIWWWFSVICEYLLYISVSIACSTIAEHVIYSSIVYITNDKAKKYIPR
jgi:hypothetical protein